MKKQATKRVPADHISDKTFKSRIYKELSKFNNKKKKKLNKNVRQMISTNISPKIHLLSKRKKEKSHEKTLYIINLRCA